MCPKAFVGCQLPPTDILTDSSTSVNMNPVQIGKLMTSVTGLCGAYIGFQFMTGNAKRWNEGEIDDEMDALREELSKGGVGCRPIVLCGPSGAGKSTLVEKLKTEFPSDLGFSVSHTTRKPRAGEQDGVHYFFSDKDTMTAAIDRGEFIEHANVHGNLYGTSKSSVSNVCDACRICILDVDVQGVKNVQRDASELDARYVFIAPPDVDTLEERLRKRGTETEEALQVRLTNARGEIAEAKEMAFHSRIVNDDLGKAYNELRRVFVPEIRRCRLVRLMKAEAEAKGADAESATRQIETSE